MPNSCCPPDHRDAIDERYGAAALEQEACLCAAVPFDPALLKVIPEEVVSRDYGCGDPTRWVRPGDRVLDLGSGSGKNAFICSQLVGAEGSVLGLDRNPNMLELANSACGSVASQIGYGNVSFRRAEIDQLAEDLDGQPLLGRWLHRCGAEQLRFEFGAAVSARPAASRDQARHSTWWPFGDQRHHLRQAGAAGVAAGSRPVERLHQWRLAGSGVLLSL